MKTKHNIEWDKLVQTGNVCRSGLCQGEVATLTTEEVVEFNAELEKAYAATRRINELMGAARHRFISEQQQRQVAATAAKPRTRRRTNWPSTAE